PAPAESEGEERNQRRHKSDRRRRRPAGMHQAEPPRQAVPINRLRFGGLLRGEVLDQRNHLNASEREANSDSSKSRKRRGKFARESSLPVLRRKRAELATARES